ncbi:MAG: alpha-E domain-containing protein, partial [Planctomycetes bacterium]|nr:alpha-E domain-containing protein [Planctomycetota bacterium]
MLSRVADSIFWMRRYTERAENVARFIDVTLNLTLGLGDHLEHQWEALVYTTGDQLLFSESFKYVSQENVIRFLTFDESNPNSILSCLQSA